MAQYDSSTYPLVTSVSPKDRVLIWQESQGRNVRVEIETIAASAISTESQITIAQLRLKDVTDLLTGAASLVGGYYTIGDGGGGYFYYDSTSSLNDNGGTVIQPTSGIGRWLRPASDTYNVREFGAVGDGSHDDTDAIQEAINCVSVAGIGAVVFPAGKYKIVSELTLPSNPACNISMLGQGPNVSIIYQTGLGENAINFNFANSGVTQPYRLTVKDLGFEASVAAGRAIMVSYGDPAATSSHYNEGLLVNNVCIRSDSPGAYNHGIDIESGWNVNISNSTISGSAFGGTWTSLVGSGVRFRRSCVNSHINNCQMNFWLTGIYFSAEGSGAANPNTEGLFCANNSLVACRRGVWLDGNPNATSPWLPGFTWTGGLVELRAAIMGFDLYRCSELTITNAFVLQDAASIGNNAAAFYINNCKNAVVHGNIVYAMDRGLVTSDTCLGINVSNNVFTGGGTQVNFQNGTTESVSRGNIVNGAPRIELNGGANGNQNKIYSSMNYGFAIGAIAGQTIPTSTETTLTFWAAAKIIRDDLDYNLPGGYRFWNPSNSSRILVPSGVNWVRVKAGIRWDTNSTGFRAVKIRSTQTLQNWAASSTAASGYTDLNLSTPVIPVKDLGITYFEVIVEQSSGGNLAVRAVEGSFVEIEIVG